MRKLGLVLVSTTGKIKLTAEAVRKGYRINFYTNRKGYVMVHVNGSYYGYVHQLVATAYIPKPNSEKTLVVNHKDENPSNNRLENLEWLTIGENVAYSTSGAKAYNAVEINQICKYTGKVLNTFKGGFKEIQALGIHYPNVIDCCKGRRKSANGFKWEYKNA